MKQLAESPMGKLKDHPFVAAFGINVVLFLFVKAFFGIVFETYDDYNMMLTISGAKTGEPYWQTTFYNSVLSFLISRLYLVSNQVQWYSVIEFGFLLCSTSVILGILLDKAKLFHLPYLAIVVIYLLVFVIVFLYPIQRMQFTTTAAMLGAASTAAFFSIDASSLGQDKKAVRRFILGAVLIVLSVAERKSSAVCCLAYIIAAIVKWVVLDKIDPRLLLQQPGLLRSLSVSILVGLCMASVFVIGHTVIMDNGDNAGYAEYDKWRVAFQDHPHPSFDDAVDLYEEVDWTQASYLLSQSLVYIDSGINEAAFKAIAQSSEYRKAQLAPIGALKLFASLVKGNSVAASSLLAIIALAAFITFLAIASCRNAITSHPKWLLAMILALLAGSFLLAFYLCMSGRWLLRTFQTIALPLTASLLLIGIDAPGRLLAKHGDDCADTWHMLVGRSKVSVGTCIAVGVALCVCFCVSASAVYSKAKTDCVSLKRIESVEHMAIEHPDNVYIHDYSICNIGDSYDPFKTYVSSSLTNLIVSGGSYTYTGCYYGQLRANNMDALTGETLLSKNALYITVPDKPGHAEERLLDYMRERYGDVSMKQVETLEHNASVYQYRR